VSNPQPASSGSRGAFALRGLFAVFFGLLVIIWPNLALFTLPLLLALLGLYILIDGIIAIVGAMRSSERRRWLLLVEGILGILAGLIALFRPGIAALAVLYLVAVWAILSGVSKIVSAIRGRVEHEWLMVASGLITVLFGVVLIFLPGAGLLALVWLIGIYALALGAAFIAYSFRLRGREAQNSQGSRVT
jgi:uncharacterized membrane protein HdeD (DUF308 family)